jgi:hypothetical protein
MVFFGDDTLFDNAGSLEQLLLHWKWRQQMTIYMIWIGIRNCFHPVQSLDTPAVYFSARISFNDRLDAFMVRADPNLEPHGSASGS